MYESVIDSCDGVDDLTIPIPRKKRYTTRAVISPFGFPPAPYDAVPKVAKRMMMRVEL